MESIHCKTQAECDEALAAKDLPILIGDGYFTIRGSSHVEARESSHVEAWESSHVEAWESSHVEARGSSHVVARGSSHVVAWGSSHVVAWGSSHVVAWESSHVEAWESSHVVARGSSHVEASSQVAVHQHSPSSQVNGGIIIVVKAPKNPTEWCDFYGAKVEDNHAILFKGVGDDYLSPKGGNYTPGTMPQASDWDDGVEECGGGFHFSPHPLMTLQFNEQATKFVACPVKLEDIFIHPNPLYPNKVKAKGVSLPCYEVNRYGERI